MKKIPIIFILIFFLGVGCAQANGLQDTDKDGISDADETQIYRTDPKKADTDGDGYSDWSELKAGYSPHNPKKIKLKDNDADKDGLKDDMELRFGTDMTDPDTDGDGVKDGREIANGTDPVRKGNELLPKRIEVNTGKQELSYFLKGVKMGTFIVSTGKKGMPTPKGEFRILNKAQRAWSKAYGLWMPYWMGLDHGEFGIHELPEWPGGYKEGANHLGKPVSHGCVRLGVGPAKFMYDWTTVGTPVFIY